jgi:hypothetical protein
MNNKSIPKFKGIKSYEKVINYKRKNWITKKDYKL